MRTLTAVVASLAFGAAVFPTAAAAGEPTTDAAEEETCLYRIATDEMSCYPSSVAMIEDLGDDSQAADFASSDQTTLDTIEAVEESLEEEDPKATEGSVITAVFYDNTVYRGSRLLMEAPRGCDADTGVEWQWRSLRSDWDDRIRSGKGYSRCQFKIWDYTDYRGASFGYTPGDSGFGAMDSHASSVRMR